MVIHSFEYSKGRFLTCSGLLTLPTQPLKSSCTVIMVTAICSWAAIAVTWGCLYKINET
jgi:hypothetical protein